MKAETLLSKAEFSRRMGWTQSYTRHLLETGAIKITKDGMIDFKAAKKALKDLSKPDLYSSESYVQARTRKESALASLRELEVGEKQGHLLYKDVVVETYGKLVKRFRGKMLALPTKLAPQLVDIADEREAFNILEEEVHEALTELAAEGFGRGPAED